MSEVIFGLEFVLELFEFSLFLFPEGLLYDESHVAKEQLLSSADHFCLTIYIKNEISIVFCRYWLSIIIYFLFTFINFFRLESTDFLKLIIFKSIKSSLFLF